jgi:DNA-binding PadR family transcriptional regulator
MSLDPVRVTVAVGTVLRAFLENVERPRYGYELMRLTGFPSGKLYPILARLEAAGWLEKEWEDTDAVAGRPRRRWYRFTSDGAEAARSQLAVLHRQLAPPSAWRSPKPQPWPGTA